jgi:hypothetical protein
METVGWLRRAALLAAAAIVVALPLAASAQSPEEAEARDCICLRRAVDALDAEVSTKQQELDRQRAELARIEAELTRERAQIDVNNPEAVAHFKQLLERRDTAFKRANGPLVGEVRAVIARYGARANEYNSRCANRPFDSELLKRMQATLVCPPAQ